ncbi:MAG: formyltransferase family protein, partial [Eubacteriales bacterium]|nr:formyltransferase family protein [Eubacteriales bacterium]
DGITAIDRAVSNNIPFRVVSRKSFSDFKDFELAIIHALADFNIDLLVLAGYLSKLGSKVINEYKGKIINIHPSLIPAFCGEGMYGIRPHVSAIEKGVKLTGATVHYVNDEYDSGPIILQKAVDVYADDTPEVLQKRVMNEAEQVILPLAIEYIRDGKVHLTQDGKKAYVV